MGLLMRVSSVTTPSRTQATSLMQRYQDAFWAGDALPSLWLSQLSDAGITVTPELSMCLATMYSGVSMISYDLATLPCQIFKLREDGGKDRVRGGRFSSDGGIGSLAYKLRYQPNAWQTAAEFFLGQLAQFLLRGIAYAEIVPSPQGFLEQLLPRHPDRVLPERLPSGRLRYRLTEPGGSRYLTQEEMFVVRDLSLESGLTGSSRVTYGANAIGAALAAEKAANRFFKAGMTAAALATYAGGQMEDEQEAALHRSIMRYAEGSEHSFGLMLVPDEIKIETLGVEPEKAQMMAAREWGSREVARLLRLPGSKLGIKDAKGYNSQVQEALDYVITSLRPIAVIFEQAIQRDLILAKDTYIVEFKLEALLRGDFETQANYLDKLIRARVMRPSEARLILNMNPDPALDRLSEQDFQPGKTRPANGTTSGSAAATYQMLKGTLALHDQAVRCLRRERAAVAKLARKHADDPTGWQQGLREFFADHAQFVAQTMRLNPTVARSYAAQHGSEFETKGIVMIDGQAGEAWERFEADELAALAVDNGANTVDDWFARRLVNAHTPPQVTVTTPVTIDKGAIQVDARTTVEGAHVDVQPADVVIAKGAVQLQVVAPEAAPITVAPAVVHIDKGAVQVTLLAPKRVEVERIMTVERDPDGLIQRARTHTIEEEEAHDGANH